MTIPAPMENIEALCKRYGFTCWHGRPRTLVFDRLKPPARFEITGADLEQVCQKFRAVLAAMLWEPAAPAPAPVGTGANLIQPGPDWFKVAEGSTTGTLKTGDSVQVVAPPVGRKYLYRSDGTLHEIRRANGLYVTLIEHCDLSASDSLPLGHIEVSINASVKVRLTDYGRTVLAANGDYRANITQMDSKGYTKFDLWQLMKLFGTCLYHGNCVPFERNLILLDLSQP
jgi:hypothetical protein